MQFFSRRKKESSIYQDQPFFRAALVTFAAATSGAALYMADNVWGIFPTMHQASQDLKGHEITWIIICAIIPSAAAYVASLCHGWWILPLSDLPYFRWLASQSAGTAIKRGLIVVSITVCVAGITYTSLSPQGDPTLRTGEEAPSFDNGIMSAFVILFSAWIGFSTAWTTYRIAGAQTMNDRYHAWQQRQELIHGQWWEKYITAPAIFLLGADGHKPQWGVLYVGISFIPCAVLIIPLSLLGSPIGAHISSSWMVGLTVTAWWGAIAKHRDGLPFSSRAGTLARVRDNNTLDEYFPTSKG